MVFKNLFKGHDGPKKIISITRESVCMGDDCTAPNEKHIEVLENDKMTHVFSKIVTYLPKMENVIWAIDTGKKVLGYIVMDKDTHCCFELCDSDQLFLNMDIHHLHCSYFHSGSFTYQTAENVVIEKYSECKTLLEKVKCQMKECFLEELKIKSGSIQIWGEWFGRPYDNIHVVKSVQWSKSEIVIHFNKGESLYIKHPSIITNEENKFMIEDATEILWVWYDYGKEPTYDHLYVREYLKDEKGVIMRVEGKRKEVNDQSGIIYSPKNKIALIIQ